MPDSSLPPKPLQPVRQFFRGLSPATDSLLWYFGGLVLFFFGVMVASGLLLSFHYQPTASAATAPDGTPLLLARITDTTTWLATEYHPGQLIPVRSDSTLMDAEFPAAIRSAAVVLRDSATGRPVHPSEAWVSVEHRVMRQTEFGALVRSVHAWGAGLLVASVLIWVGGLAWRGAWRYPSGAVWGSGLLLLVLVFGSAWTGSVLPWDRLGYAAAWVGSSLPEQGVPFVGESVTELMRGGKDVGGQMLTRTAAAHTALLPIALLVVLVLHGGWCAGWWRGEGVSRIPAGRSPKPFSPAAVLASGAALMLLIYPFAANSFTPSSPFFLLPLLLLPVCVAQWLNRLAGGLAVPANGSDSVVRQLVCWVLAAGVLLTLAISAPWSRGAGGFPIDLSQAQIAAGEFRPEWYFLGFYQLLEWFSASVAMAVMLALFFLLLLLPGVDRAASAAKWRSAIRWLVCFALLLFLFLTLWGYMKGEG